MRLPDPDRVSFGYCPRDAWLHGLSFVSFVLIRIVGGTRRVGDLTAQLCSVNYYMVEWSQCPAIQQLPDVCGGAWTFRGTRVPVAALFENLEGGATVSEFLEWFPGVDRRQVDSVLEFAASTLAA